MITIIHLTDYTTIYKIPDIIGLFLPITLLTEFIQCTLHTRVRTTWNCVTFVQNFPFNLLIIWYGDTQNYTSSGSLSTCTTRKSFFILYLSFLLNTSLFSFFSNSSKLSAYKSSCFYDSQIPCLNESSIVIPLR